MFACVCVYVRARVRALVLALAIALAIFPTREHCLLLALVSSLSRVLSLCSLPHTPTLS